MDCPLSAQTALLQALALPGYGLELAERVRQQTGGQVCLRPGSIYPALRALERRGWIRGRVSARRNATGRPGRSYEQTPLGVAVATAQREALAAFFQPRPRDASRRLDTRAMRERIGRAARVSAFVLRLRGAVRAVSGHKR